MTSHLKYHVQGLLDDPLSFPFHRSITALWEEKWKKLAHMGIYPFSDGHGEDYDLVFDKLIKENNDDVAALRDPDQYAQPFMPVGESLTTRAKEAELAGDTNLALKLYLRAGAVFRMARFPINRETLGNKAWELGRDAYLRASPYMSPPNTEVAITHTHAKIEAGEDPNSSVFANLRIPEGVPPAAGWPLVLLICGLDAYRIDHSSEGHGKLVSHLNHGQAVLLVDIPGTADSPAARHDPEAPDRLWSSVFDWVKSNSVELRLDMSRVAARGISTGGYYAMRIAHTHATELKAVVAQGGGSHHMLDPEWIDAQNHMEYPFSLVDALAFKFGYESATVYRNSNPRSRFSLLENGIFDKECTRLLLVNGMEDSIFPIEDSILALRHGRPKDARFVDERGHMGAPEAEGILRDWLIEALK